jgi:DNA polymerase-3 subunit gamma/tau
MFVMQRPGVVLLKILKIFIKYSLRPELSDVGLMLQIGPYVIPDTTPRPTSGQTARVLISSASRSAPAGRPRALLRLPSPRYAPAAHPRALLRPPVAALCSGRPFPRSAPPRIAALPSTSPPLAARASTFRRHSPTSKRWTFRSNPASARPVPAAARADAPNSASNPPPTPDEVLPSTKMLQQGSSTPLARGDHRR